MDANQGSDKQFLKHWVSSQAVVHAFVFGAVRNAHDAEEVIQEVAQAALESFDQYDPSRPFTAWVMQIARRRVVDSYRRRPAEAAVFDMASLECLSDSYEQLADELGPRLQALEHCLKRLHPRGREALLRRYQQQSSVQQIAGALGTTANAVSVLLYSVRMKLATCIERRLRDAESSP